MFSKKIMEAKKVKERYVMSEIRSFDERFRIAYCKSDGRKEEREWNCWSENSLQWKRRRNYTAVFFLLRRPKVTRVTRVRSNDECVFFPGTRGNYHPTVFGNWTNPKTVTCYHHARLWRTWKNGSQIFFFLKKPKNS